MLEREDRRISEKLHFDELSANRRFSFTAAVYNCLRYQQYKAATSAPRLVVELVDYISSQNKGRNYGKYFKCINLPSDLMYLTHTWHCSTCSYYNFSLQFCTVIVYMPGCHLAAPFV